MQDVEYFLVFNVTKVSPDGIKQLITRKNFVKLFAKQTSTKTSNTKRKLKFQHFEPQLVITTSQAELKND